MTSKGLILYYSVTGNTKASVDLFSDELFEKVNARRNIEEVEMGKYSYIVFATSTWGRGIPPKPFFKIRDKLSNLSGKTIALIGSGRSDFEFFCGALDLLEQITQSKNTILFKYKYEGYPTERNFDEMKILIKQMEELI